MILPLSPASHPPILPRAVFASPWLTDFCQIGQTITAVRSDPFTDSTADLLSSIEAIAVISGRPIKAISRQ